MYKVHCVLCGLWNTPCPISSQSVCCPVAQKTEVLGTDIVILKTFRRTHKSIAILNPLKTHEDNTDRPKQRLCNTHILTQKKKSLVQDTPYKYYNPDDIAHVFGMLEELWFSINPGPAGGRAEARQRPG